MGGLLGKIFGGAPEPTVAVPVLEPVVDEPELPDPDKLALAAKIKGAKDRLRGRGRTSTIMTDDEDTSYG